MANEFAEDLMNFLGLSDRYRLEVNRDKIDVLKDKPSELLDMLTKMNASLNEKREAMGYDRIDEEYADKPMFTGMVQFGEGFDYDIPAEI